MDDLLSDLKKGRYEFKEPWRATDRSLTIVIPIVCNNFGKRSYVVLEEVKDRVRIVDTGGINALRLEGNVGEVTFIRGGTMLKGFTQERATQFGFVITPSRSEIIPVHCIHASRGIRSGAELHVGESAPMRVYSSMLRDRSQRQTWLEVEKYNMETARGSPTFANSLHAPRDDLLQTVEAMRNFNKDLHEILRRIPDYVNQVGTVIIDPDGIVGLEVYDHPDSWKAFSETIVRSFGDNLVKEDKTGLFKPDLSRVNSVVQDFIDLVARFKGETVFTGKKTETVVLHGDGYVGEYTCLEGKTIHLLVTRSTNARYNNNVNELRSPADLTPHFRRTGNGQPQRESAVQRFLNWGKRKTSKGKEVMAALDQEPKTWTDLENGLVMSKATLSSRLKELQKHGVVVKYEGSKGTSRYGLTAMGQDLLRQNGVLHSQDSFASKHTVPREIRRSQQERSNEECPACHSTDSALLGFDRQAEHWECLTCRHKWTRARKE
jgi:DNA-binding HxlR family transcriptional regulator